MHGQHDHTLDSKNRITIPKDLREPLISGLVMTRGYDACICIYPPEGWQALREFVESLPQMSEDVRKFRRLYFGGAVRTEMDKMGRIILPSHLRDYARIDKDTTILGVGNTIEIWAAATYRKQMIAEIEGAQSVIESVMNLGLHNG